MENTSGNANATSGNAVVEAPPTVPAAPAEHPLPVAAKKRKETERTAACWQYFEKIKDEHGVVIKGKCIYCAKKINGHSKIHGTSSLKNHVLRCLKFPHSLDSRQSLLTLQPSVPVVEAHNSNATQSGVLGSWKFEQDAIRKALAEMVVHDELAFKFVQGVGFKNFLSAACPRFKLPSRWTISRDCYNLFVSERGKLKNFMKSHCQRISLTTDSWTSIQRINYMAVTAHFIDDDWNLHKKIISFVPVTSHKGEYIAKALESSVLEWGIKNVFTVTVDNASSNDTAIGYFKKKLLSWGASSVRVQYLHMRCIAHILNLIVTDGLKEVNASVKKVREAIRYIRNSPQRLKKFRDISDLLEIQCKLSLTLDTPTRWNSTYTMLNIACCYEKAFDKYDDTESSYRADLGDEIPDYFDWECCKQMVAMLKIFFDTTMRISGSLYVTSNAFLSEICDLNDTLNHLHSSSDLSVINMSINMRQKFDKYWGDPTKMNSLVFIASILDPRFKLEFIDFSVKQIYGAVNGSKLFENLKAELNILFTDYVSVHGSSSGAAESVSGIQSRQTIQTDSANLLSTPANSMKARFKKHKMESGMCGGIRSEIDIYLGEATVDDEGSFDILRWWKLNSERFPILSHMARDVLAVPVATVASEAAFSTGGRVLDAFRSSLTPKIVEALICTQDWLRMPNQTVSVEETLEDLESFEKGYDSLSVFNFIVSFKFVQCLTSIQSNGSFFFFQILSKWAVALLCYS